MGRSGILIAVFIIMFFSPCFAENPQKYENYIISFPKSGSLAQLASFLQNTPTSEPGPALRPIFGTGDYAAELSSFEANALIGKGYTLRPNRKVHSFIDESADVVNATLLWAIQEGGQYLNGTGRAICVIDSGINYSHEAFGGAWGEVIVAGHVFLDSGNTTVECNSTSPEPCLDYNGHGTLVSGIIASINGTYRGMAPGAKLVVIKALNGTAGGSADGYESDIVSGINYCLSLREEYNISAISMSFGTGEKYSDYCDRDSYSGLVDAINNATLYNVSVVAAAGNNASTQNISSPACIQNVTPVGNIYNSGGIYASNNYWQLPILFAPGVSITTTSRSGGYVSSTGTSASAAHVSGIFAIMGQYISLLEEEVSPQELEDIAIGTGWNVTPSQNHSAIDAYAMRQNISGMVSIEEGQLQIEIISPENGTLTNNTFQDFSFNVSGSQSEYSCSLTVNGTQRGQNSSVSNATITSIAPESPLDDGIYVWHINCTSTDSSNTSIQNIISIDSTPPQVSINSPLPGATLYSLEIEISLSVNDTNLNTTIISIINSTGSAVNTTQNSSIGNYTLFLSVPDDGLYNITATAYDLAGNSNISRALNVEVYVAAGLEVRPEWSENSSIGNASFSSGEAESESLTRSLYTNLNQTKSLLFYVINLGADELENLTAEDYGFIGLNISLEWADGSNISEGRSILNGESKILNLTIYSPDAVGDYLGSLFINSSNGAPYGYANLSLNITATNQTLPKLDSPDGRYYINSYDEAEVGFDVYYYDNATLSLDWASEYNLSVVEYANHSNTLQEPEFVFNSEGGLFSGAINASELDEGNYTLYGELLSLSGNQALVNLTFEIIRNIEIEASIANEGNIIKGYNFTLSAEISKSAGAEGGNITACIELPSQLHNTSSGLCKLIENFEGNSSETAEWQIYGDTKGVYTINISAYSEDGRFNATEQKSAVVRYGALELEWYSSSKPPSTVDNGVSFYARADVTNSGNLNLTNVQLKISFSSAYFEFYSSSTSDTCSISSLSAGASSYCEWRLKPKATATNRAVSVSVISSHNSTSNSISRSITIIDPTPAQEASSDSGAESESQTAASQITLSFIRPTASSISVFQGGAYALEVSVKNTGNTNLKNLYLEIAGIESEYYEIDSNSKLELGSGSSRNFGAHLRIPSNFEARTYPLTLRIVSDEKTWTRSISLVVRPIEISYDDLEDHSLIQGGNADIQFTLKNTGEHGLNDVKLSLLGLEEGEYNITPQRILSLLEGGEQNYTLSISLEGSEFYGDMGLFLEAVSDEKSFSYPFILKVLPTENERKSLQDKYHLLSSQYDSLLEKKLKIDEKKSDLSGLVSELDLAAEALSKIDSCLQEGNFAEAKSLILEVESTLNSLDSSLSGMKEKSSPMSVFMFLLLAFIVLALATAGYFAFTPKKGYLPGKGYTIYQPKNAAGGGGALSKMKRKLSGKSAHEIERERKLREWRQYYENAKKKKAYAP
jgi:uncharacterized membrane protein